jgi:hypothetical protein
LHGENEVFQRNRNDFPKVSFTLDVIWGHMGHYFAIGAQSRPFPDLHWLYLQVLWISLRYMYTSKLMIYGFLNFFVFWKEVLCKGRRERVKRTTCCVVYFNVSYKSTEVWDSCLEWI